MHTFTRDAQEWLDKRFRLRENLAYQPHSTNVDYGQGRPGFLSNLGMTYKISTVLSRLTFDSVLDVGASDGFNAAFVQKAFNAFVVASDLSPEALCRAQEQYGLPAVGLDCHQLPFRSNSFDVVLCNETIEHVFDPVMVMLELYRVAKRFVIISTLEYEHRPFWRNYRLRCLNPSYVHAHRTIFTRTDFVRLFPDCVLMPQLQDVAGISPFELSDRGLALGEAKQNVTTMSECSTFGYRKYGVLALVKKDGTPLNDLGALSNQEIADKLFEPVPAPEDNSSQVKIELAQRLACPNCLTLPHELTWSGESLTCSVCNCRYGTKISIPLLFPRQGKELAQISDVDWQLLYPGVNRDLALSLETELSSLRRISSRFESSVLRYATAGLNLLYHPLAFTRHHLHRPD